MRFCVKCGAIYEDSDTIQRCDKRTDAGPCRGEVPDLNVQREADCLVCLDRGWVHIHDPREKKPEVRRCSRGCGERGGGE